MCRHQLKFTPPDNSITPKRKQMQLYESCEAVVWGRFASANRICVFQSLRGLENASFRDFSACETYHGCDHANLGPYQLFAQSMHGAELLHAPKYASFVSCKIIAIDFLLVFHIEKSSFPNIFPTKNVPSSTQVYTAGQ